ncbi:hypothetical protein D3C87_176630 [compost metagenome]
MIFKTFLVGFILGVSSLAAAQGAVKSAKTSSSSLLRFFYNPEVRYENGNSQAWEARTPINLAVALKKGRWSFLFEKSNFDESSGSGNYEIKRTHHEMVMWVQRDLLASNISEEVSGALYAGAGVGGYQEQVETTFMGETTTDKSQVYPLIGVSGGAESVIYFGRKASSWAFIVGLEGRVFVGQELDPNPQFSALARLGIQF